MHRGILHERPDIIERRGPVLLNKRVAAGEDHLRERCEEFLPLKLEERAPFQDIVRHAEDRQHEADKAREDEQEPCF